MKSYKISNQTIYTEEYEFNKPANLELLTQLANLEYKGLYDLDINIYTSSSKIINYLDKLGQQDMTLSEESGYIQFLNSVDYTIIEDLQTTYKIEIRTTTKKAQKEIYNLINNMWCITLFFILYVCKINVIICLTFIVDLVNKIVYNKIIKDN